MRTRRKLESVVFGNGLADCPNIVGFEIELANACSGAYIQSVRGGGEGYAHDIYGIIRKGVFLLVEKRARTAVEKHQPDLVFSIAVGKPGSVG